MEFRHNPIMLREVLEMLNIKSYGQYVDGTMGGAGHSSAILSKLGEGGILVGIDRDQDAIKAATQRLQQVESKGRFCTCHTRFSQMKSALESCGIDKVDGILLDLGVSSYQLDNPERGFSYKYCARLDMRMDRTEGISAYDVVNEYPGDKLVKILKEYGEERYATSIVRRIIYHRDIKKIETTTELADIIKEGIPVAAAKKEKGHPAKRSFQGIRCEVNGEMREVSEALDQGISLLKEGGRLCVITFHSIEDRIVKEKFKQAQSPCTCPPSFPVCVCGKKSLGKVITGKPIVPSDEEIEENNRAHSAKLRVFERI